MKLKTDFITNSSSVAFVVIGVEYDIEEFFDLLKEIGAVNESDANLDDVLWRLKTPEISFDSQPYSDTMMIGMPYTQMQGDETLTQFKSRVGKVLKEKYNLNKEPYHIQRGWENR